MNYDNFSGGHTLEDLCTIARSRDEVTESALAAESAALEEVARLQKEVIELHEACTYYQRDIEALVEEVVHLRGQLRGSA